MKTQDYGHIKKPKIIAMGKPDFDLTAKNLQKCPYATQ
jgi:hypothetical protein